MPTWDNAEQDGGGAPPYKPSYDYELGTDPPRFVAGDVKPSDPPGYVYVRTVQTTAQQAGWTLMLAEAP